MTGSKQHRFYQTKQMSKKYIKNIDLSKHQKEFWNYGINPITGLLSRDKRYIKNDKPLITEYVPT